MRLGKVLAIFVGVLFIQLSAFAADTSKKFLDPDSAKIASTAPDLYVSKIAAMHLSPIYIPPNRVHPSAQKLSKEDRESILGFMQESQQIDPVSRFQQCQYEPGLKINFAHDQDSLLSVLVCFNCDLWALGESKVVSGARIREEKVVAYGDLRPYRGEVLKIVKKMFPDDPSFAALK